MIDTTSKFLVRKFNELALPHKCISCGASEQKRTYIDFGYDLDYYGAMYFCNFCFTEAAGVLGFVAPSDHEKATSLVIELQLTIAQLVGENNELRHAVGSLSSLVNLAGSSSDSLLGYQESDDSPGEIIPESTGESEQAVKTSPSKRGPKSVQRSKSTTADDVTSI